MAPPNRARKRSDDISKFAARRVPTRDGVLVRKVDVVDRDAAKGNEDLGQNLPGERVEGKQLTWKDASRSSTRNEMRKRQLLSRAKRK